jgi:hypothetical protein
MRQVLLFSLVALALVSLLIYSQWRPEAPHVSGIIEAAENRLVAAEAIKDMAKRELNRTLQLYPANAVSRSEYDQIHEKFVGVSANVEIRENDLAILKVGSCKQ